MPFYLLLCHLRMRRVPTRPCLRGRRLGIPGMHAPHVRKQSPCQPPSCAAKDSGKLQPARFWCLWNTRQVRNGEASKTGQWALFFAPQQPSHIHPTLSAPIGAIKRPKKLAKYLIWCRYSRSCLSLICGWTDRLQILSGRKHCNQNWLAVNPLQHFDSIPVPDFSWTSTAKKNVFS